MIFWKKTISVLLIHAFLLSSLPIGVLQPALAATPDNPATAAKEITTNPEEVIISRDYGIVKSKFVGKGDKLIVHIQDAHCNYEAQSNIAKIVESLVRNNTLSFISVEGADGLIDTSWFKAFPDAEVRKEVANYFMKKGEITGPEFLSITTDYPIKLFGAETREYYIQNLNAFTASYPSKDETEKYLNGIKAVLNRLQNFIYNADLKAMDSKSREHESKAIQFNEYVRFLQSEAERHKINLRQYDNLFKLINVLIYEKKIDFSVTDKERSAVIDELSKALPKDVLTELVNKSISFKVGKVSSSEYYEYLKSLAAKNGIELSKKYPNLSNYIIYNSVYSKIDNEKLFNDIKEVEAAIKEKLFENEDQRTLERLSRHIDTLLGLINIKLLNGEFEYYKTHKEEFAPESFTDFMKAKSIQFGLAYEAEPPAVAVAEGISKLEDFYAIAIKRDKALVDNTLEGMTKYGQRMAVLVTGGFHSEGMAKLLEKQGVSYVVVCPNITKDVPTPYIQVLTNQRTSFEDILSGPQEPVKQNMLAPALISWAIGLNSKEFRALSAALAGLKDRTEDVKVAWINEHLLLWLRKALQHMGQHRMAHDKNVLRDAYRMAVEHAAQAAGQSAKKAKDTADAIISSGVFTKAFDAAYSALTAPDLDVMGSSMIAQVKEDLPPEFSANIADLPPEFPADRYEWARGPKGEDLTGIEIWDKKNHTVRFRPKKVGGEWEASNYGGGMPQAPTYADGVKTEIGRNMPSVEIEKISDNQLLLKNTETGKELNISVVKTTIAGVGTRFCMIGNRTYEVAGDTIVLSNLFRHNDAQDMLAWVGNQALLDFFGMKPGDIFNITVDGRSSGAKPYLFDALQEPISRIANPEFFPPNPALEDLEAARKYLTDTQYNRNASPEELITRLHYIAVLSRSNISVTPDYGRVIEDLAIVTRSLMEMRLNDNQTVSKVAKGIFNSISLAVIKGERPARPELSTPELSPGEFEKLLREEPFIIEDPDKDFPRLQAIVTNLILEGKWKLYILVNIKDFSGFTYAAYAKFVEAISRKYNGNITFILSIENPRSLRGDLAGTYTARRRAIDALGDDFWLNERIITEPDGGEKVRAANAGVAFEQWSKTLSTDGNSFLEDNILTGSAMWLLLPKLGKGKNGQNYKPWLASDGRIRFGKMNMGGKPLSQIPDDLELAACGLDALVMTKDQMAFIRTRVSDKASSLNKNIDDIFEDELEEILYATPVGVDIRANIDKRELIKRGIFVVGENRVMSGFLEKGGGEKLPIKKRYVNLASIAYKSGNGKVLENLWFILEDSRTSLDIIKRFATTRTVPASKEEFIGRVPAVSSFQEIFQGFIYASGRPWADQIRQALHSKRLYGISYGEGAQPTDIASIGNYFEMWERYVRRYKGDKEVGLDVSDGVKITYRGDKDKLRYLLRNVKIVGNGTLEIGDGVLIQGGTIAVNGTLVIPDRTKIIDSQLLGDLEFNNEAAMVLAVSFEPKKYIFYDNGKRIDKLVIYGDETITTQTYLDGTTHIVRFINSVDYKDKIYQMVGGHDRWAAIRDKFALYGKMYENFDDVSRMRLDDVIKTEDQWVQLVKFIFTPTLSIEELSRVNAVINNLADEYAAKKIDQQALEDKIADALKTLVSARFTLTDQKVFQDGVNNILGIVTKPSGTWSHQDIDEVIAQSYRRRAAPQIAEALKSVTYANVKEEPYCKALYRILASMHPAIITDVDHGPLAWNEVGAHGEEKAFHDLSLYGGDMSHGDAKRATDSFAMAWILGTRTVPAATHVDFDTPVGLYGGIQGAITANGAELTPEQKIEVSEKIRADFKSGKARFIGFVAYEGGADIYEIPSLEECAYLLAHPGRGGDVCDHRERQIYMSPSRLNWYDKLDLAVRQQFLYHEITHINHPDWDEAKVTEAAGIDLVLAAVIKEDINTKIGSVSLRDVLNNPNGAFEISVPEIIKLYGSNIKWAIDRMRKSTAGTRGILDKEDILGGPQLNAAVITFMAQGYADYINANFPPDERGAFIGFDPRYFSKEFAWLFTRVLLANGIKVYRDINEGYSQTPVTSYMAYYLKIACGIEITSSHNPPNQNGIKSMTWYGGVDTDDVSARIAAHIQSMYDEGIAGKGAVKIASYDASRITAVDAKELYYDNYMSRLFDEKTVTMMKTAMDSGARFIFDGLYGVGGPSMEYYLDRIFAGYDWRGKIIIMNASPDPSIGGIERPDPSKPRTLEVSGVLEKLASTPGVLIAVTADMDADRIGTAVIIPEKDVARAKRYGLFVSHMEFAGSVVNIVRFTPNQIFTLISYERILQAYERKIGTRQFDEIKRAIAEGRAPELYLLTSIPSSLIAKQMIETFGGKTVLTTVGFKNLGYEAEKLDRERPDAVVVSLLEESGGANIGPFTKDSRGSGIHRDKDTISLALALFALASELSLEKKNMLDLYVDMAEKLGGLFYYERIDAYLPNQPQAESLLEADQKISEAVKEAFIKRYRAIDHVKERGASRSNLDDPKNIAILAELFGKRPEDITGVEERPVANTVLLIGEGNDWQHVQPIAKRFTFKDKEVIEVFHTGREDQEGPSIAIYDAAGNFKARALLRASGTESLIRAYLEIFEPQSNPHPENLYVYFTPLLRYLGLQNYSMEAQGRDYLSDYIETVNANYGVSEKRLVPGSATFEVEKTGAAKIGQKLHTPLDAKGDKALAAGFLKAGYNKDGKPMMNGLDVNVAETARALGIEESTAKSAVRDSINRIMLLNDFAESVGIKKDAALNNMKSADMIDAAVENYTLKDNIFGGQYLENFRKIQADSSANPRLADLTILRIERIILNSVNVDGLIGSLARKAGRKPEEIAEVLNRKGIFPTLIATWYLSHPEHLSKRVGPDESKGLTSEDLARPQAGEFYNVNGVRVEFRVPDNSMVNLQRLLSLQRYQAVMGADMARGEYNYRGSGTRQTVLQFFNDYFLNGVEGEDANGAPITYGAWYGKIREFIEEAFGLNGEKLEAIVTNGIGANDQFMWALIKMYNENKPPHAPAWYHVPMAREFARLRSEGKIKPDSTLFIDISRSGTTWEGMEVASRSLSEGFNNRIAIVNGGPSKDMAIAAAQQRSMAIGKIIQPLIIEISPDIGGRNMHRKTSIYYTAQTIAGMFLPSMDSKEFARLNDKFDQANDFAKVDESLPVSAGRFLQGAMNLLGAEHIVFITNTESLRRAGTEWEEYIMEGSNKKDVISMGIHNLADKAYEPSVILETLADRNNPASNKCVSMALLDESAPTYLEDLKRVNKVAEAMPIMIFTVKGAKIEDAEGKVIDTGMTAEQQAAFDILWTDLVTVFTTLLRVDANSNPNVKKVREYTAERVAKWRAAALTYAVDPIGKNETELLVSYGSPASPEIGVSTKQASINTIEDAGRLGAEIAEEIAKQIAAQVKEQAEKNIPQNLRGRDRLNIFVGSEDLEDFAKELRMDAYESQLGGEGWITQTAVFPLWSHKGLEGNLANQAEAKTERPLLGDKTVNIFVNARKLKESEIYGKKFNNTIDVEIQVQGETKIQQKQLVAPLKNKETDEIVGNVEGADVHQTNDAMTMPNIKRMAEVSPTVLFECNQANDNVKKLIKAFFEGFRDRLAQLSPPQQAVARQPASAEKGLEAISREQYIYNTYVGNDAAALHQTLVGLGVNTDWTKNKRVLILYDTAIDPTVDTAHVARAGEAAVNKYMNGAIIEVRGTGKALYDAAKVQAGSLTATDAIVTIAGDATLKVIGAEGLKDLGKVINVQNPDNRYIPVIGLYDLALRIAYDLGDEKILECLDRIAVNDPKNPTPWTIADIRKGVIIILPKIRPVDMAEAVEAYKAAQAALASL